MFDTLLRTSLEQHIPINIIYKSDKGLTQRNIKVLKFKEDKIEAYCYLRKQRRIFKIDSILGAGFKSKYLN